VEINIFYRIDQGNKHYAYDMWSNQSPNNILPRDSLAMTIQIKRNLEFILYHKFADNIIASWDHYKRFNQNQILISTLCLFHGNGSSEPKWQFFTKDTEKIMATFADIANAYSQIMVHCADSVTAQGRSQNHLVGLTPLSSLFNEVSCIQRQRRLDDADVDTVLEYTIGYDLMHKPIYNTKSSKHFAWGILTTKSNDLKPELPIMEIMKREVMKASLKKNRISKAELPTSAQLAAE
jgi:hypothetical protein